jgi:hypothetical protein
MPARSLGDAEGRAFSLNFALWRKGEIQHSYELTSPCTSLPRQSRRNLPESAISLVPCLLSTFRVDLRMVLSIAHLPVQVAFASLHLARSRRLRSLPCGVCAPALPILWPSRTVVQGWETGAHGHGSCVIDPANILLIWHCTLDSRRTRLPCCCSFFGCKNPQETADDLGKPCGPYKEGQWLIPILIEFQ